MSERRIISDPALANGQPLIEGTEVSVQQILTCAGSGIVASGDYLHLF